MYNLLILEKEPEYQKFFKKILAQSYYICFESMESDVRKDLKSKSYDVIILSVKHNDPFCLLQWITSNFSHIPVIVTSRNQKTDFVVKVIKQGAFDFIPKPLSEERLLYMVKQALENQSLKYERDYLRRNQDIIYNFDEVVTRSSSMKEVIQILKKFSKTDATILMTGETGTGKSSLAGTIHFNSFRKEKPFICINCANIQETLLESELFGHEKGSFTNADKLRIGRFEQAKGGTVFLDEIGEIGLPLQAKLLNVLDKKCFERVGGSETIYSDIRFIVATNRNIEDRIRKGLFREDLYYRINVLSVKIPPLRERKLCIKPLSYHLLKKIARSLKKPVTDFSPEVLEFIESGSWRGNIRELANCIERAVILEESSVIQKENFPMTESLKDCISPFKISEKDVILEALEKSLWIQKDAAMLLGVSPRMLNYRIRKLGIIHHRWRKNR